MSAGRLCVRTVHLASPREKVREAARRMREAEVGTLVVVDERRRPVGIVTDRDLVLRCVAEGRDPGATEVAAVMTAPALCVAESTPIEEALRRMMRIPARRLVVTDDAGELVGILSLDDVVELLVEEAETIGRLLRRRPAEPRSSARLA